MLNFYYFTQREYQKWLWNGTRCTTFCWKWKWSHSVLSNSLQPHGLSPTRLLHPWDFPGKNTGVGCHFLLQGSFLIQGSNPDLLHWRQILYLLSHQGSFLENAVVICTIPEKKETLWRCAMLILTAMNIRLLPTVFRWRVTQVRYTDISIIGSILFIGNFLNE